MKQVLLRGRQGLLATVDDEDFDLVSKYIWRPHQKGPNTYAVTYSYGSKVRMHRMILGAAADQMVDHDDRNGLNNQKHNLRVATVSQNNRNRRLLGNKQITSSRFKGVSRARGRWAATIGADKRIVRLGFRVDEETASHLYDVAAVLLHREYASTNHELLGIIYDPRSIMTDGIRSRLRSLQSNPEAYYEKQAKAALPKQGEAGVLLHGQRLVAASKASRFKGVTADKTRWRSQVKAGGENYRLGSFANELTAAHAYDVMAILVHGENAVTNAALLGISYDPKAIISASLQKSL